MSPSLHLIPEVLLQIAPHLDTRYHFACLKVSHLWHAIFTPYFWESVNDYQWPWCNLLRPLDFSRRTNTTSQRGALNPGAGKFQELLDKYWQHVRRMVINYDSLPLLSICCMCLSDNRTIYLFLTQKTYHFPWGFLLFMFFFFSIVFRSLSRAHIYTHFLILLHQYQAASLLRCS
jgi:hypothetical protein